MDGSVILRLPMTVILLGHSSFFAREMDAVSAESQAQLKCWLQWCACVLHCFSLFKVQMSVLSAARIECSPAVWTDVATVQVFADGQLCLAHATQHGGLVEPRPRPGPRFVVGRRQLLVALVARVVRIAADET